MQWSESKIQITTLMLIADMRCLNLKLLIRQWVIFWNFFLIFFLLLTFIEDTYESQDRDGDGEYLIFLVFQMFTWAVRNIST